VLRGEGFAWAAPQWLQAKHPPSGKELVLGLRPQSLTAVTDDPAITLQVDLIEYLGTESHVVGRGPGGQRVAAMLPGDAHCLAHHAVGLAFDPAQLHVFDADTGLALRP
jgi:ABC-type sugar transport system ATPase subunit